MENRNEGRLGLQSQDSPEPIPEIQKNQQPQSGINYVIPTEYVDLPSKGLFYSEGHPLYNSEKIEIKQMTATEEDILTNKDFLRRGIAVDKMIESILVDKRIRVDDLLLGDKSAIIIASRISAYGKDYETKIICPSCGESIIHAFDLEELETNEGITSEIICQNYNIQVDMIANTFTMELPITKKIIECKLLTGKDEKLLSNEEERKKKLEKKHKLKGLVEGELKSQLRYIIQSIDGETDKAQIKKFIDVMPAKDSRHLRTLYKELTPTIDVTQHFECPECHSEKEVQMPFSAEFFWIE